MKTNAETTVVAGCLLLLFNMTIGGMCFAYSLFSVFGKDIPWYGDFIAGLFLGQFAFPLMVICWIIRLCGVQAPFIH